MTLIFISDLHLSPRYPEVTRTFLDFLSNQAFHAECLYILGDLFDYWIGDDAIQTTPYLDPIIKAFKQLTSIQVKLCLMHGNRDFLLGNQFCQQTGVRLISDPTIIQWQQKKILLMHGDSLCTADKAYMDFRRQVRNPQWQQAFLEKSLPEREQIAQHMRITSNNANQIKADDILDVTPLAVEQTMQQHNVQLMIHGHTHRPGDHHFKIGGQKMRRMVLGAWHQQGSMIIADDYGLQLVFFPLANI